MNKKNALLNEQFPDVYKCRRCGFRTTSEDCRETCPRCGAGMENENGEEDLKE